MCTSDSTPDPGNTLADKITAGAAGNRSAEAAAIVLTETLRGRLVDEVVIGSTGTDWAEIDWPATRTAETYLSSGEYRLLALADSLSTHQPVDLADILTGLDPTSSWIVLGAVAHAMGFNRPSRPGGGR